MNNFFIKDMTIAIPAFNEEWFIKEAILSAVHQANIVIYDNASTDRTREICLELVEEYEHIQYVRHLQNGGSWQNFKCGLEAAQTEYFMWLGAHDKIPPDYVRKLISELEGQPDAVLAYASARHITTSDEHRFTFQYPYSDDLASADVVTRITAMIRNLSDWTLLHGIYRTEQLRQAWFDKVGRGADQVLLCNAATLGRFIYVKDVEYFRRDVHRDPAYEKKQAAHIQRTTEDALVNKHLERLIPEYSRDLLKRPHEIAQNAQMDIVKKLQFQNVLTKFVYIQFIRMSLIRKYGYFNAGNALENILNGMIAFAFHSIRTLKKVSGPGPRVNPTRPNRVRKEHNGK